MYGRVHQAGQAEVLLNTCLEDVGTRTIRLPVLEKAQLRGAELVPVRGT